MQSLGHKIIVPSNTCEISNSYNFEINDPIGIIRMNVLYFYFSPTFLLRGLEEREKFLYIYLQKKFQ